MIFHNASYNLEFIIVNDSRKAHYDKPRKTCVYFGYGS